MLHGAWITLDPDIRRLFGKMMENPRGTRLDRIRRDGPEEDTERLEKAMHVARGHLQLIQPVKGGASLSASGKSPKLRMEDSQFPFQLLVLPYLSGNGGMDGAVREKSEPEGPLLERLVAGLLPELDGIDHAESNVERETASGWIEIDAVGYGNDADGRLDRPVLVSCKRDHRKHREKDLRDLKEVQRDIAARTVETKTDDGALSITKRKSRGGGGDGDDGGAGNIWKSHELTSCDDMDALIRQ